MSTTAQSVFNAAIARFLSNDGGNTALANDSAEWIAKLSRVVRQVYTLAGMPQPEGGMGRANYFTRTTTVVVGTPNTTFVTMPTSPEFAYIPTVLNAAGILVSVVSLRDLRESLAELPPAIIVADGAFRSAARAGDPAAGETLTLDGSYLPPDLTAGTDYIGATTPATASTSHWPAHVGDQYLIDQMAYYWALKSQERSSEELQALDRAIQEDAQALGQTIGVAPAKLSQVRPT